MKIREMLIDIFLFINRLKNIVKNLSEDKFNELLGDKSLDYEQKLYLIYFRYK